MTATQMVAAIESARAAAQLSQRAVLERTGFSLDAKPHPSRRAAGEAARDHPDRDGQKCINASCTSSNSTPTWRDDQAIRAAR